MAAVPHHLPIAKLEAGLMEILRSPRDEGVVTLMVRRPREDTREVVDAVTLDRPDHHLGVMNARVAALVAGELERRPLTGDHLYVDLDLSQANLPPGTRLQVGEAIIEVVPAPLVADESFAEHFGSAARKFVNTPQGRAMRLRGFNARVIQGGVLRTGDTIKKIETPTSS